MKKQMNMFEAACRFCLCRLAMNYFNLCEIR